MIQSRGQTAASVVGICAGVVTWLAWAGTCLVGREEFLDQQVTRFVDVGGDTAFGVFDTGEVVVAVIGILSDGRSGETSSQAYSQASFAQAVFSTTGVVGTGFGLAFAVDHGDDLVGDYFLHLFYTSSLAWLGMGLCGSLVNDRHRSDVDG